MPCSREQELEVEVEASESTLKVARTMAGMRKVWMTEERAEVEILMHWQRWAVVVAVEGRKQTED